MKEKPIAVIHWIRDGTEHESNVYTQRELTRRTEWVKERNYVSWTCLLDTTVYAPRTSPRRAI